jgi:hypothetical protein
MGWICKDMDADRDCINQALLLGMGGAIPREFVEDSYIDAAFCYFLAFLYLV